MPEGWKCWLEWLQTVAPENTPEIQTIEADAGEYLGYVRLIGRRKPAKLEEYCWPNTMWSIPMQYTKQPLLRGDADNC
jgi:hypothetical protein